MIEGINRHPAGKADALDTVGAGASSPVRDVNPTCAPARLHPFPLFGRAGVLLTRETMKPSPEIIDECLEATVESIGSGLIQCLLCGSHAEVAHCWIPDESLSSRMNTPINRNRTIGYGLCHQCDMCLTNQEYEIISDRLVHFIRATCPHMPRGKLPAIFLN